MAIMSGNYLKTTSECKKCGGKKCWDKDSAVRQRKALAMFGKIPNSCVDAEIGGVKCPFHS